ncbi:hypothetical protein [Streptomyces sp. NBC_01497]|uniref:hypothetical protein n=1 Tax=Streptomyces sp. NBC_01497 TaxID=2903885 RepID=UPI002E332ABC|nr:hypothetical protein [Streptomyces sp. NBC_01497]
MIRQRLKVVAVAGVVVLALTGFSHHGHSHGSGGTGGGCSGPSHTSDSGTSDATGGSSGSGSGSDDSYDDDTDGSYGGSSGSYDDDSDLPGSTPGSRYGYDSRPTGRSADTASDGGDTAAKAVATVRTVRCASPAKGGRKAVTSSKVEVTASLDNGGTARFDVDVVFDDAGANTVDTGTAAVRLKPGQRTTVTVPMNTPSQVSRVAECEASVL